MYTFRVSEKHASLEPNAFTLCCIIAGGKSLVESFYIPSVWCFMTFKWSMLLLSNAITDDRSPKDTDIGSIQEGPEGDDSMVPP